MRREDPADRRAKVLGLTSHGRRVFERIEAELSALRARVFTRIDCADLKANSRSFPALQTYGRPAAPALEPASYPFPDGATDPSRSGPTRRRCSPCFWHSGSTCRGPTGRSAPSTSPPGALRRDALEGRLPVCGTVLGAAMSVVLAPNLVNAPILLSLAVAL